MVLRPRISSLIGLAAVSVFVVAGATARAAAPDGPNQLFVVPANADGSRALNATRPRVIARYGSFSIAEAAGPRAATLRRAGAERRDDMRAVQLGDRSVDLTTQRPALVGPTGRRQTTPTTGPGLALVQFVGPVKDAWLQRLRATGVRVVTYMAQNAYLVHGSESRLRKLDDELGGDPIVRAIAPYEPSDKLTPPVDRRGPAAVAIQTLSGADGATARAAIAQRGRTLRQSSAVGPYRTDFVELSSPSALNALAADPGVVAVTRYAEPHLRDERTSQIIAGNLAGTAPALGSGYLQWLTDRGFATGGTFDFAIDVTDEGIDTGTVPSDGSGHPDLYLDGNPASTTRLAYDANYTSDLPPNPAQDCGGHGTINASIAGGFNSGSGGAVEDASSFNYGLGVAPRVLLGGSKIFKCTTGDFSLQSSFTSLTASAYANGARISNNSWGSDVAGAYDADSQEFDALVRDAQPSTPGNQQMVEVVAAGNAGSGSTTVGSPATGKNVITVGASESVRASGTDGCGTPNSRANDIRDVADFSSRGPTGDGREKPDVVAPGTHVAGAQSQALAYSGSGVCDAQFPAGSTLYALSSGTSHSTPLVSGAAALIRDRYTRTQGAPPSPAMTKAILVSSANDEVGGRDGAGGTNGNAPDNVQGWGLVNLGSAFDLVPRSYRDQVDVFGATGQSNTLAYTVQDTSKPVKATLVWTDPPGPTAGNSFVNDLNLELDAGGLTYKGNNFSGGVSVPGGTADPRNNVESVYLPAGTSGSLSVRVIAANIAGDGVPGNADPTDQDYALVISNASVTPPPPPPPPPPPSSGGGTPPASSSTPSSAGSIASIVAAATIATPPTVVVTSIAFLSTQRSITTTRKGAFSYSFTGSPASVSGRVSFGTAKAIAAVRRRKLSLGSASFRLSASRKATVKIKLSRTNFAILKRKRILSVKATVTIGTVTKTAVFTLKAPRR